MESVVKKIERILIRGMAKPGDKLKEVELAEKLNVSRTTIREALRKLDSKGLVELIPNRGAFVREHTFTEILELYDFRAELTGYAARVVADKCTPIVAKELNGFTERMAQIIAKRDFLAYHDDNLFFHNKLIVLCGNRRVHKVYMDLVNETQLHRVYHLQTMQALVRSFEEHKAIVKAICDGCSDLADQLGRDHVLGGKIRYVNRFGG